MCGLALPQWPRCNIKWYRKGRFKALNSDFSLLLSALKVSLFILLFGTIVGDFALLGDVGNRAVHSLWEQPPAFFDQEGRLAMVLRQTSNFPLQQHFPATTACSAVQDSKEDCPTSRLCRKAFWANQACKNTLLSLISSFLPDACLPKWAVSAQVRQGFKSCFH